MALLPAGAGRSASAPAAQSAKPDPFELEEATILDLQKRMVSGQESARSLAEKYTARIEALDRRGPALASVLEINPDAIEIAAKLDEERKAGRVRGPLHGIPILVKDNIGTADRMTTTAGSLALEGSIPSSDSFVAKMLREAGAVILGKTNLSEWARSSSRPRRRVLSRRRPTGMRSRRTCGSRRKRESTGRWTGTSLTPWSPRRAGPRP